MHAPSLGRERFELHLYRDLLPLCDQSNRRQRRVAHVRAVVESRRNRDASRWRAEPSAEERISKLGESRAACVPRICVVAVGLRIGEVLALQLKDFDLDGGTLVVQHGKGTSGGSSESMPAPAPW